MSNRDELRRDLMRALNWASIDALASTPDYDLAEKLVDAPSLRGYYRLPQPKVIGYVVVDRDGQLIGKQFQNREAAQAFADEWTADCKTAGIDWEYRVAEIVEAAA